MLQLLIYVDATLNTIKETTCKASEHQANSVFKVYITMSCLKGSPVSCKKAKNNAGNPKL